MRFKNLLGLVFILALVFITIGDRVLPAPLNQASRDTRTSLNQFLIGLFPDWEPKNPNRRTEEEVEQLEQGQSQ
ncbi:MULTISPECIES: hypothetical protein [unclassified Coleofasciculus]|uniref:hypothetical protein n=1 Tax=unclassified Coleofasciculus TaxID=2692782 RepID=UPI0018812110|nr:MULTISPECIES: hypothetical protein [unclassified Coleofasciculus]MBE9127196.1 hypothetical protein [Coleofasciculus sp. LEGE 07081]MBE9150306.1 hypothetical protein [Coleofasciculus sp. LEGE 07092]